MNYFVDHIPKSTPNNRRPAIPMSATSITIHNTANPTSTAKNERAWLINPSNTRTASYHIVVDDRHAIECIPLNEVAWHAGDGRKVSGGNMASIGIEICESGNYAKTLDNSASLVAKLLYDRGWGTERLRRHYDWSGKICPRLMYDGGSWAGWAEFLRKVDVKLNEIKAQSPVNPTDQPDGWAMEAWEWAKENGITDGSRPKDTGTRQEFIAMLYRYEKSKGDR